MYGEPPLPVTPTDSGHEAKGTPMVNLELAALIPVFMSLPVTIISEIVLLMLVKGGGPVGLLVRGVVGLAPTVLTLVFVLLFIHKKPPHYAFDSFELMRTRVPIIGALGSPCGIAFNATPRTRGGVHPLLKAKQALLDK